MDESWKEQYNSRFILALERFYGTAFVSPGGESLTKEFILKLKLRPGQKVLDVGSGSGGAAFYLARQYGVHVYGVDYSQNMINLANSRLENEEEKIAKRIVFKFGDISQEEFEPESFDVIHSRDVLLYLKEKDTTFKRFHEWLKPGGQFLITDFCRGPAEPSQKFLQYAERLKYNLMPIDDYAVIFKKAGFKLTAVEDLSETFLKTLQLEWKCAQSFREAFVQDFGEECYQKLMDRWQMKIDNVLAKQQTLGLFNGIKE